MAEKEFKIENEKRAEILCPECMRSKLETVNGKDAVCPNCGEKFEIVAKNTVRYKNS